MSEFDVIRGADDRDGEGAEDCKKGNSGDEGPTEFSAESDKLLEVQQVVDELFVLGRELQLSPKRELELEDHLSMKVWKLLSKEGLEELSDRNRQEARVRILEAWGLCLKNVENVEEYRIELSTSEVEALYRPLEASTVLKSLSFVNLQSENLEPESGALLADILHGAKALDVFQALALPPSVLSSVAKAVASSGRGPLHLRELVLEYQGEARDGSRRTTETSSDEWAGSIATLIRAAPNLEKLRIVIGALADEDGAKLIGRAVASHRALQRLTVRVLFPFLGGDSELDACESDDETLGGESELDACESDDETLGGESELDACESDDETLGGESELDACESDGQGTTSAHMSSTEQRRMGSVCHLLSGAFLELPRPTSIRSLSLSYYSVETDMTKVASMADLQVLSQVLQSATHITEFELEGVDGLLSRDVGGFLTELRENSHLQSLKLEEVYSKYRKPRLRNFGFDRDSLTTLVDLLKCSSMPGLKDLSLTFPPHVTESLDWPSFYTALSRNSTIETLNLDGYVGYQQAERELLDWIQSSRVLQTLSLVDSLGWEKRHWRSIFKSLRENTCLRRLTVESEALEDDDAYRELMAMLQVNSTLQDVTFNDILWGREREATVRAALTCRARQESYLAQLRRGLGQAKWQSPRCGRVFLCGSPEAGKTRLTRSMLKVAKGKSLKQRFKEKFLRRTEGVEIHTLRNDDLQLLVWDLAGQDIFHALQQFLFPRLSRASMFIFVFSPYYEDGREKKRKLGLDKAFEKEFLWWLKFIASNSAITGFTLPQVMVVISHRDLYKSDEIDITWSRKILEALTDDFKGVLDIDPIPHFIDGHMSQDVKQIVDKVYFTFNQLLEEKLFKIPIACTRMSQELVSWASKHPKDPIIKEQTFFTLCGNVTELRSFSKKCQEDDNKRLLKAVGSYLHDVGTMIDMTSQEVLKPSLIVVNPNWLTHVFLGHFISLGHGFQRPEEGLKLSTSVDGFFYETDFQDFLHNYILEPMKEKFPTLTVPRLKDLMENLDLLYSIEIVERYGHNTPRYFIPTLFQTKTLQKVDWHHEAFREKIEEEMSYLGMRLRCKDSKRTYLSPAFFSRFQVVIWRKLNEELQSNNPMIECKFNMISLLIDGFDILIEIDQDGDFIDVLIRSSKSRRTIWKYVEKYIVEDVRDFCASSKGCPGVELVMHIIRTECVKRLSLCTHRTSQSVAREDLKKKLIESVQNMEDSSEKKDLYSHTWLEVPEAKLGAGFEEAVELLPPEDVDEVYAMIKRKTQLLEAKVVILRDVINAVDGDSQELSRGGTFVQSSTFLETMKFQIRRSRSEQYRGNPSNEAVVETLNLLRIIRHDIGRVDEGVRRVDEGVKEVLAEVQHLKREIQEMNRLQRKEAENLSQMNHKLDLLMGYSASMMHWPRRPYFTHKDVSVSHRITAVVDIGKPLMIHFQCEERCGHHIVSKQPGYGITVGKGNCEFLRQISKNSVRVIWYLLKAGLHISTGMGDLVPELQTSDGNTTSLNSLSMASLLYRLQPHDQDGRTSKQIQNPCSPEEAWRYLQDFLENNLKSRITEYFLLHRVQYFDRESTRAWLCQECIQKGLEGNKLKKL